MKIIGGKDYYDGAGYGVDETCVFARQNKRYIAELDHITDHPFRLPGTLRKYGKVTKDVSISPFVHMIAGELIPGFICRSLGDSPSDRRIEFAYSEEDLQKFYTENAEHLPKSTIKNGQIISGQKTIISKYVEHLKEKASKAQMDWAVENHVSVMTVYWRNSEQSRTSGSKSRSQAIVNHANLKDFELFKVIDPATLHMRISNYISGVLPFSTETVELQNTDRIRKAGFDLKTSFRKPAQK